MLGFAFHGECQYLPFVKGFQDLPYLEGCPGLPFTDVCQGLPFMERCRVCLLWRSFMICLSRKDVRVCLSWEDGRVCLSCRKCQCLPFMEGFQVLPDCEKCQGMTITGLNGRVCCRWPFANFQLYSTALRCIVQPLAGHASLMRPRVSLFRVSFSLP